MSCDDASTRRIRRDAERNPFRLPGNVLLFRLLERQTVIAISPSSGWDQLVITDEVYEPLGPSIEDLVVHLELRNPSGGFECRVAVQRKLLDGDWSVVQSQDVVIGGTPLTTADYYVGTPYTDRSRMGGIRTRLLLQYHIGAGGSTGAKAELTVNAALRLFGC